MADENQPDGSLSGLDDKQAQEFHEGFIKSFLIFTGICLLAHILVWIWRPWIPGDEGYASLMDSATTVASAVLPYLG